MSGDFRGDGSEGLESSDSSENGDVTAPLRPPSSLSRRAGRPSSADKSRRVCFPEDDSQLVTGYLEPVNPWQSVAEISSEELIEHYLLSCQKHQAEPMPAVIQQLKEWPYYGGTRRGVLRLSDSPLKAGACEALEAVLRRARFTRIEICRAGLTDETAVALFDMMEYYESASELDISGNTDFGILGWQACSRMVNKSQWLEQLEARGTSLSESTAPVLGRALRPACVLRCLQLQRSRLQGRPLLCLASALKQNRSVRELHLGDNQLLPEDAQHLGSLLKSNSSLQLLDVSNNDIQDAGVEAIADALAEQSTIHSPSSSSSSESTISSPHSASSGSYQEKGLVVLVVWNNNLTRNSGQHFSKALSRCRSLEVLNMGQNPLGGETANRIRGALQQNRSLLSLGVQGARLGAEAAVALAEVIEDNPILQRIDLRDNKIQVAGLLALVTAMRKNFTITRLDLDDAPPHTNSDQPLEEARLVEEIRSLCSRNEAQAPLSPTSPDTPQRRRVPSFASRKISLTCQTLGNSGNSANNTTRQSETALSPPRVPSGRLRSPLPSPVPSPASSPIPSPSHRSRFHVSRVSDASESPSPSTPPKNNANFFPHSRFKVVQVAEPPTISVQAPQDDTSTKPRIIDPQVKSSRFSVVRNVNIGRGRKTDDVARNITKELETKPSIAGQRNKNDSEGDRIGEMKEIVIKENENKVTTIASEDSNKASLLARRLSEEAIKETSANKEIVAGSIKKNKSESSLDSPDLEVSRLMQHQTKAVYDSSSSLDISGSSMESLNDTKIADAKIVPATESEDELSKQDHVVYSLPDDQESYVETEDVFPTNDYKNPFIYSVGEGSRTHPKRLANLSASSNESSLESSTFETGVMVNFPQHLPHQSNLLNSSVSSNESVSPNIFGKHMKLHGSVTSLEASVSSLDSYRSGNNAFVSPSMQTQNPNTFSYPSSVEGQLAESSDSGIFHSDPKRTASFNESFSSNEGTLTSDSNLKSSIFSMGGESLSIESDTEKSTPTESLVAKSDVAPRRVTSLLDVPSMQKQRSRKISWVAPTNVQSGLKKDTTAPADDSTLQMSKVPTGLEKLLSLFHPSSLFSRTSDSGDKKSNDSSQTSSRRDSQTSMGGSTSTSFWPWGLGGGSSFASSTKGETKIVGPMERLKKYGESFETTLQDAKNATLQSFETISGTRQDKEPSKTESDSPQILNSVSETSALCTTEKPPLVRTGSESPGLSDYNTAYDNSSAALSEEERASTRNIFENILKEFDNEIARSECAVPERTLNKYCLDSEYIRQTIDSECVLHPFTSSQIAADDYTLRLKECTCDRGVEGRSTVALSRESTTEASIDDATKEIRSDDDIWESVASFDLDQESPSSNVPDENMHLQNVTAEQSQQPINEPQLVQIDEAIDVRLDDITAETNVIENVRIEECVTIEEPKTEFTNLTSEVTKDEVSVRLDSEDDNQRVILLGSEVENVFNFNESGATDSTKDSGETDYSEISSNGGRPVCKRKTLSDSERECITEIVRNICEEAVVAVVSRSGGIAQPLKNCDNFTQTNNTGCVNTFDVGPSSGSAQVQNQLILSLCDNARLGFVSDKGTDDNINNDLNVSIERGCVTDDGDRSFDNDCSKIKTLDVVAANVDSKQSSDKTGFSESGRREIVRPTDLQVRVCAAVHCPPKVDYASVLKQSIGVDNKTSPGDRQSSPESGPSVENLPSKIIRRIKENISPENTLTSSMSNTKALAQELLERRNILGTNVAMWEMGLRENVEKMGAILEKESKLNEGDDLTGDTICRLYDELLVGPFNRTDKDIDNCENVRKKREFSNEDKKNSNDNNKTVDIDETFRVYSEPVIVSDRQMVCDMDSNENRRNIAETPTIVEPTGVYDLQDVDQGSDALTILDMISDDPTTDTYETISIIGEDTAACADSLSTHAVKKCALTSDELIDASMTNLECSDDNVTDRQVESAEVILESGSDLNVTSKFQSVEECLTKALTDETTIDVLNLDKNNPFEDRDAPTHPIEINILDESPFAALKPISILKKANSTVSKTVSLPQDIPKAFPYYGYTHPIPSKKMSDRDLPIRCGSLPEDSSCPAGSPKSLPDCLTPLSFRPKSRSPVNTLGKKARDSLDAIYNRSDDALSDFHHADRLASLESVKSLGSVSEDIEDLSSNYVCQSSSDSKGIVPGVSQDSLASLGSISENVSEADQHYEMGAAKGYDTN